LIEADTLTCDSFNQIDLDHFRLKRLQAEFVYEFVIAEYVLYLVRNFLLNIDLQKYDHGLFVFLVVRAKLAFETCRKVYLQLC